MLVVRGSGEHLRCTLKARQLFEVKGVRSCISSMVISIGRIELRYAPGGGRTGPAVRHPIWIGHGYEKLMGTIVWCDKLQ